MVLSFYVSSICVYFLHVYFSRAIVTCSVCPSAVCLVMCWFVVWVRLLFYVVHLLMFYSIYMKQTICSLFFTCLTVSSSGLNDVVLC